MESSLIGTDEMAAALQIFAVSQYVPKYAPLDETLNVRVTVYSRPQPYFLK